MKKLWFKAGLICFAIIIIGVLYFIFGLSKESKKVCIKENCFLVEIADNDYERARGLMNRKYLGEDEGMLFIFDKEGIYGFWMKNTLIPLDIIWIYNNKIVHIEKNAVPCVDNNYETYMPDAEADSVLEINAGITDKLRINVGDEIEIN